MTWTDTRGRLPSPSLALLLSWPSLALLGLVVLPALLLIRISVAPADTMGLWSSGVSLAGFEVLFEKEPLGSLLNSLQLALLVAAVSLVLGYPLTFLITRMGRKGQVAWLLFLLATLSLSDVLTAFSWQVMLSKRVGLSNLFVALGWMSAPESLTPTSGAVIACLVYLALPFMVLTLFPALSRLEPDLVHAARTMGASPVRAFVTVILPMTRRPAAVAFVTAAILTVGAYVPPLVLGRPQNWPMAVLIGSTALAGHDLPRASAMSLILLAATAAMAGLAFRVLRGGRHP